MPINFLSDQVAFLGMDNALQKMSTTDFIVGPLDHIGALDIEISNSAPTDTTRLWFDPNNPSTDAEGVLEKYEGAAWQTYTEAYLTERIVSKGVGVLLDEIGLFTKPQRMSAEGFTFASNVAFDFSSASVKTITLTSHINFDAPTNIKNGSVYILEVTQDGTDGHGITWNSVFDIGAFPPVIPTDANKLILFFIYVDQSGTLHVTSEEPS